MERLPKIGIPIIIGVIILVVIIAKSAVTIESGEAGVLYKPFGGGVVTEQPPLGEGFHIVAPWNKVFIYEVRRQELKEIMIDKKFGSAGDVVVIEDLISSGKSSLEAVEALRKEGLNVKGLISIFTYGLDAATKNFKKEDCEFISLCNYSTLLKEAVKQDYIKQSDLEVLEKWRKNPSKWKK